jgi:hypothetical protein
MSLRVAVSTFSEGGRSFEEYSRMGDGTIRIPSVGESDRAGSVLDGIAFLGERERSSLVARGRFRGGGLMARSRENILARYVQNRPEKRVSDNPGQVEPVVTVLHKIKVLHSRQEIYASSTAFLQKARDGVRDVHVPGGSRHGQQQRELCQLHVSAAE